MDTGPEAPIVGENHPEFHTYEERLVEALTGPVQGLQDAQAEKSGALFPFS